MWHSKVTKDFEFLHIIVWLYLPLEEGKKTPKTIQVSYM